MLKRIAGAAAVLAALAGCVEQKSGGSAAPSVEQQAWADLAAGATVFDVRTPEEFAGGHLPGAVNIPHDQIAARAAELPAEKGARVILYCRTGRRSGLALETLKGLGYTNAVNAGGYDALMRARPAGSP